MSGRSKPSPANGQKVALATHDAVLEAAVVGKAGDDKLIKLKAYVVLKPGVQADET